MPIDQEKQRARWKRNKSEERSRAKAKSPSIPPIDPKLEEQVWAERDKRLKNFPWSLPRSPSLGVYPRRTRSDTYPLICDVWAVETLLKSQAPDQTVSDGMIARWLFDSGRTHGVKLSSLRTKVWRARKIVRHLEDAQARIGAGRYWPKFPESVAEHGSGVMQHVKDVFEIMEMVERNKAKAAKL